MKYTLHQLEIFHKVSELQSVTKASEELFLTQPAVSIQLKNFQDQFQIPLFEVVGRKIYITEIGKEITLAAEKILKPNGMLTVVSFHSIEDRIIKKFFLKCAKNSPTSRYLPDLTYSAHSLKIITKKPILPSEEEILRNKRSRSAKLRVATRTFSPSLYGEVA